MDGTIHDQTRTSRGGGRQEDEKTNNTHEKTLMTKTPDNKN